MRTSFFKTMMRFLIKGLVGFFLASVTLVLLLRWINPPLSSIMLQYRLNRLWSEKPLQPFRHEWVVYEDISPTIKIAVIAAEDQAFANHAGVDFQAIKRAFQYNRDNRRIRGASTISQQVAKNMFLWSGKNWIRKGLELYFTLLIESLWGKRRILEIYLNVAQMGEGVYGIQAASAAFFQTSPKRLTRYESSLLAAVLPNPVIFSARYPSAYVRQRQRWILRQIHRLGGFRYLKQLETSQPVFELQFRGSNDTFCPYS